jgi:hypothetical protein
LGLIVLAFGGLFGPQEKDYEGFFPGDSDNSERRTQFDVVPTIPPG